MLISLGCWRDGNSGPFANLIVADDAGKHSVYGAGRVPPDCRLDCESETVAEDTPFVPQDDSEWQVALMMHTAQRQGYFLAATMQPSNNLLDLLASPSSGHLAWMDNANDLSG
jgi:hypothetical protein